MRRRACSALMFVATALWSGAGVRAAPRPSAGFDLVAGGGYDTNLFLLVAADPDSPTYRPYSGWFARVAPAGVAALSGDDMRFELRAGADIRQTTDSGTLFIEDAQLGWVRPDVGPVDLRLALAGSRFDATVDANLRFFAAGGTIQATWRLADRWRSIGAYRLAKRWYGAPAQLGVDGDLTQDGELRLVFSPSPSVDLGANVGYLDLRSSLATDAAGTAQTTAASAGSLTRASAGLDVSAVVTARTSVSASAWAGRISSDGTTSDLQLGGAAAASVRLFDNLEALVRYDVLADRRREGAAGLAPFERQVVLVGLVVHAVAMRREPVRPRAEVEADPDASELGAGQIRFRLRAPGATDVAVIGSWNGWAAGLPAQRLLRTREPGVWEAEVWLPAGTHHYRFLVDGRAAAPRDGARVRPDGFGGQDQIIEVSP